MRFGSSVLASLLSASGLCVFLACSSSTTSTRSGIDAGDDGTNTTPTTTPTGESDPVQTDGGKPPGRIYAHTPDTLFLFDPLAGKLAQVGKFGCLDPNDSMIDIAVDATGKIYGTSFAGFLTISATDAKCTYITRIGGFPNSLGFVPAGTLDPAKEALVGYIPDANGDATKYVRIDTATGAVTVIGSINGPADAGLKGTQYGASGDIIGLSRNGNRAFVTVTELPDFNGDTVTTSDSLAEIDPKTGAIKSVSEETHVSQLFGLGQWAGQAYGFSGSGAIVAIDLDTGRATPTSLDAGAVTDAGTVSWFGAGVTTAAPTKP